MVSFTNYRNVIESDEKESQYKLLFTISNNVEIYEEPVPRRTKKFHHCAITFGAGEENTIGEESLFCKRRKYG